MQVTGWTHHPTGIDAEGYWVKFRATAKPNTLALMGCH